MSIQISRDYRRLRGSQIARPVAQGLRALLKEESYWPIYERGSLTQSLRPHVGSDLSQQELTRALGLIFQGTQYPGTRRKKNTYYYVLPSGVELEPYLNAFLFPPIGQGART